MQVRFKKLTATAKMPTRAHAGDAGIDLYVDEVEDITEHHDTPNVEVELEKYYVRLKSNIAVEIPKGYVGLLYQRSSVYKTGEMMTNCVGVIDSNYRGSVDAVFTRFLPTLRHYQVGDRFAQLIIMPYPDIELVESTELSTTDRGEGGYGSTGK